MPNSLSKQIVEEGPRNAIVKLSGILDTSDASWIPAVAMSDFSNNEVGFTLSGLRVDKVQYTSGPRLTTILEWNSAASQLIVTLQQAAKLNFRSSGGLKPDRLQPGYDGAINLRTLGFVAGNVESFTILLSCVKIYT